MDMMSYMNNEDEACVVGKNFKKIRTEALWPMVDLAEGMKRRGHNWTKVSVYKIETGERRLKVDEAIDAFRIMGLDINDAFARLTELSSADRSARKATEAAIGAVQQMLDCKQQLADAKAEMFQISRNIDPADIGDEDFVQGATPENIVRPSPRMLERLREVEGAVQIEKVAQFVKDSLETYIPLLCSVDVIDGKLTVVMNDTPTMYQYVGKGASEDDTEEGDA